MPFSPFSFRFVSSTQATRYPPVLEHRSFSFIPYSEAVFGLSIVRMAAEVKLVRTRPWDGYMIGA